MPAWFVTAAAGAEHVLGWGQHQQCMDAAAAIALLPRRAPDLETPAGRLVLALSCALMLLVVLYLPLYFAWRIERHHKSSFMTALMRASGNPAAGSSTSPSSSKGSLPFVSGADTGSTFSASDSAECKGAVDCSSDYTTTCATASGCGSACRSGSMACGDGLYQPSAALPQGRGGLATHLLGAAVACFVLAELFVWLCSVSPRVAGMLWQQIPAW